MAPWFSTVLRDWWGFFVGSASLCLILGLSSCATIGAAR